MMGIPVNTIEILVGFGWGCGNGWAVGWVVGWVVGWEVGWGWGWFYFSNSIDRVIV